MSISSGSGAAALRNSAFLLALLLSVSGCQPPSPPPPPPPPEVLVTPAKLTEVPIISRVSGRVAPSAVAEIRPQVGGIILKRLFTEGGEVKAGQALYQIDVSSYVAEQAVARATLNKAQAAYAALRDKAARYANLVAIDGVSKQEYADALAGAKQAQADIEVAKAQLAASSINVRYGQVLAPLSGKIGQSGVTQGALVTANQATALAKIQQLDPIYVEMSQSVADLQALRRTLSSGDVKANSLVAVSLMLPDGSTYEHTGTLQFAENSVAENTGSVLVRATFPNPNLRLLPGMFVNAAMTQGTRPAVLVTQKAVTRDVNGKASVLVVDKEGKAALRAVEVAQAIQGDWAVIAGLNAGEQIITGGLMHVKTGAPVKIVPTLTEKNAANLAPKK